MLTFEHTPLMLGLLVCFQTKFILCYVFTLITIEEVSFISWARNSLTISVDIHFI